jgi:hypothetical protein
MSLIYLSGPITGLTFEEAQETWRDYVKPRLEVAGHKTITPLRFQSHRKRDGVIGSEKLPPGPHTTPQGITLRDLWDVERCDLIFCNLLEAMKISLCSVGEVFRANVRKPQIIVVGMEPSGNPHDHVMLRHIAQAVLPSLDEMIKHTLELLA